MTIMMQVLVQRSPWVKGQLGYESECVAEVAALVVGSSWAR